MTFLALNPEDARHTMPGHPEHAGRVEAILSLFRTDPVVWRFPQVTPDRLLTQGEALSVHTARLWLNLEGHDSQEPVWFDPDTYLGPHSRRVALATARLAVQAAHRALREDEPGFVVARPPGHHATRDRSMGFCLLNNVAIAARAALAEGARRVLVFDHDVHHGNGTQDIFYETADVLYQSFHLFPHYPGTGAASETGRGPGLGYTMNAPLPHGAGDAEVRSLLANVFLPAARAFRPDLILVSAGFDSVEGDPLGGLWLTPSFFGEITRRLAKVCPRIVSFLEGGYHLDRMPEAARHEALALDGRPGPTAEEMHAPPSQAELLRTLTPQWPTLR